MDREEALQHLLRSGVIASETLKDRVAGKAFRQKTVEALEALDVPEREITLALRHAIADGVG